MGGATGCGGGAGSATTGFDFCTFGRAGAGGVANRSPRGRLNPSREGRSSPCRFDCGSLRAWRSGACAWGSGRDGASERKTPAATAAAAAKGLPAPLAPSSLSSLSGPGTSDSQPKFIPEWRVVGPGEERVEGVLERIECDAKAVAFYVKTPQGEARFTATALDQVEFITYRDDLTGAVGCGALKQALPVYVTRSFSADRKSSRVVAVEFLPKQE